MNFGKNPQHDFPKMRGGGQQSFGTFPKIHPFLKGQASLRCGRSWRRFWGSCPHLLGSFSPTKGAPFYIRLYEKVDNDFDDIDDDLDYDLDYDLDDKCDGDPKVLCMWSSWRSSFDGKQGENLLLI